MNELNKLPESLALDVVKAYLNVATVLVNEAPGNEEVLIFTRAMM
jgi:hypothetical protein